ncbi:hypothetical protein IWX90DRAFT_393868, partial [Phyllosticta citrichinensis]
VDRLAVTFQRPITGIHNRTYGVLGDVAVCLFQRSFRYNTADVRCAYEMLKLQILEPSVEKVVLLAHGQGACVASLALDRMLLELPSKSLGKLEIFTFGCAASHFNNPLSHSYLTILLQNSSLNPTLSSRSRHVVPIIEHYANENDPFARWGVLNSTRNCPGQRFAGQVFINKDASGHLFNQHYLDAMGTARGRRTSVVDETQFALGEGAGRTVRQLSRLWLYVGGGESKKSAADVHRCRGVA